MFLNLDAGEFPDEPPELWALADVINCACGGHAGDAASMEHVAAFCAATRTRLGAHPSYPDRQNFGRHAMAIEPSELAALLADQLRALAEAAAIAGTEVLSVKPHGALYHAAAAHEPLASAVIRSAVDVLGPDVLIIGLPHGAMHATAGRFGVRYAREGFADRTMRPDGTLVPRSEPHALITDPAEAVAQAVRLAPGVDTISVHADTPHALAIARAVREALGART